jgi:hypothetical protein
MSTRTTEVPNGIMIAPPGMAKIPKGSEIKTGVPPAMDLDEAARLVEGPMLALCGVVRSDDPDQHPAFQYVRDAFSLPEVAARDHDDGTELGGALVVFPAEAPHEHRVYLNDEVRIRADARAKYGEVASGPLRSGDPSGSDLGHVRSCGR